MVDVVRLCVVAVAVGQHQCVVRLRWLSVVRFRWLVIVRSRYLSVVGLSWLIVIINRHKYHVGSKHIMNLIQACVRYSLRCQRGTNNRMPTIGVQLVVTWGHCLFVIHIRWWCIASLT